MSVKHLLVTVLGVLVSMGCAPQPAPIATEHLPMMEAETRHQTDFLTAGDFTHVYPGRSKRRQEEMIGALRRSGYSHIYVYVMNENDYDGPNFNFYGRPQAYRELLVQLRDAQLYPVVWLAPDDAPGLHRDLPPARLIEIWTSFIPAIDDLVSSYVLGLEMDEYWSEPDQLRLGRHLRSLTEKPIFVHYRPGLWQAVLEDWADGIIFQYGFDKSPTEIAEETRVMLDRTAPAGKLFIAGEYSYPDVETSIELGNVALDAGAHGFGNGGSPRWRTLLPERTETALPTR